MVRENAFLREKKSSVQLLLAIFILCSDGKETKMRYEEEIKSNDDITGTNRFFVVGKRKYQDIAANFPNNYGQLNVLSLVGKIIQRKLILFLFL